ncbi:glutathione S-transferase N-terminal domain-containing protein [Pseudaestuariivita sp.]|uniref:glutathione S-transferase N-terminal domain-containing protein n=1 Tax=Pseudaestuariivita sp. TaxID=2211669 RepID=UPI0040592F49
MTYVLHIGDYAYSSWSLRGWLLFEAFGIPRKERLVPFDTQSVAAQMAPLAPAKTVPTAETPEGGVLSDTLAIAEALSEMHSDRGFWPAEPRARAAARSIVAEMHSSFGALRGDCPMNLRKAYTTYAPSAEVAADVARIEALWSHARSFAAEGPWLFGAYCIADAFYAPVAARIAGYGIAVGAEAQAYVDQHLADTAFRRWRALGLVVGADLPWYAKPFETRAWPGPAPLPARAFDGDPSVSENDACPYSGAPVTHALELNGRVFGFCNATCRDKTVADPEAWPAFMALTS